MFKRSSMVYGWCHQRGALELYRNTVKSKCYCSFQQRNKTLYKGTDIGRISRRLPIRRQPLTIRNWNGCSNTTETDFHSGLGQLRAYCAKITSTTNLKQDVAKKNRDIIATLLGIDPTEVKRVSNKKLIDEEKAPQMLRVLNEFKYPNSAVLVYPELLHMAVGATENYIRIMQESLFPSIKEPHILRFRSICNQSILTLQEKMGLPHIHRIVERNCIELEEDELFIKDVISKLPLEMNRLTLFELRSAIAVAYFQKLGVGTTTQLSSATSRYSRVFYRSMNWIKRNFRILKSIGFENEKILNHFYLMYSDPNNLSAISQIQSLGGMSIREICNRRPKILTNTYKTLLAIEEGLIRHNIQFKSVYKYPEIYTLSAATILKRLQEIDTIPEFQLLKSHPRIARVVYYYNKAKARLEEFQSHQLRMPSLHILSSDTKKLKQSISASDIRIRGVDIIIYVANILQVERRLVRESLMRHPHWLSATVMNIKPILSRIQEIGNFTNAQIVEALPLLLYPVNKIEQGIEEAIKFGEASPKDAYFLQMVLYFIEKTSHFSGDAIWHEIVNEDDEETENNNTAKTLETENE